MGRVIGPGSAAEDIRRTGTVGPGFITGVEIDACIVATLGGPIGAAGARPRPNPGSNGGPEPNPRGIGDGPSAEGTTVIGFTNVPNGGIVP